MSKSQKMNSNLIKRKTSLTMKSSSHAVPPYLQEAVMLFQIFILETCPNLQEMEADETHSDMHEHTLSAAEAAAIWQHPAEDTALHKSPPTPAASRQPASPAAAPHVWMDVNLPPRAEAGAEKQVVLLFHHQSAAFRPA